MVVQKSTHTRIVGIITDKVHPYTFSSNRVSKLCVGMHLVCYFPYYPCMCIFALPSLLTSAILIVFYTCYCYFFLMPYM